MLEISSTNLAPKLLTHKPVLSISLTHSVSKPFLDFVRIFALIIQQWIKSGNFGADDPAVDCTTTN